MGTPDYYLFNYSKQSEIPAGAEVTKKDDPVPGCRSLYSGGDGVILWSRGNVCLVTDSGEDDTAPA